MKYGLIGEHLGHSFSKAIHEKIADYVYEIKEIEPDKVEEFMRAREFSGINVTIPYKEKVIPMLDYVDESAKKIGAVNTVVNRNGKLYGYNTDYSGMKALVLRVGAEVSGKKVLIIGTGGTSKTARAVVTDLGAKEIIFVSNIQVEGALSYEEVYANHTDVDVIFNTSPVGMYPKNNSCPIDLSKFDKLTALIDVVYNPIQTKLVREAKARGIKAEGGLYMLVAQAVRASEIFLDKEYPEDALDRVFNKIYGEKENIVLIGMPASGKSTVGSILAKQLCREFIDTDDMIIARAGMPITDIFAKFGEKHFRDLEEECVKEASARSSVIIATGGGVPLRESNVKALKQNGRLFFIDRPLESLVPTESRPLSSDRASIEKRYNERYSIYCASCDVKIDASCDAENVAKRILEKK